MSLTILGAEPWSGEVGAEWKYQTNTGPSTGDWPRFVGFGLDSPPANTLAVPGYDDSAWALGHTTFHNNTWVTDGGPDPYPGCTVFGGVVHDGNDKIWLRKTGYTRGGDLAIRLQIDDVGSLFIDGELVLFLNSGNDIDIDVAGQYGTGIGASTYDLSAPVGPGLHTFALYVAGDGLYGQAGIAIVEGPSSLPLPPPDLDTAMRAETRVGASLNPLLHIPEVS